MSDTAISYTDNDEALRGSGVAKIGEAVHLTLEPSGKTTVRKEAR